MTLNEVEDRAQRIRNAPEQQWQALTFLLHVDVLGEIRDRAHDDGSDFGREIYELARAALSS